MDTLIEPRMEPRYHGERRAERRKRVLKGATITFNRGYGALQCVARNMTDKGAMLAFGDTAGVPAKFEIQFAHEDGKRKAHVRWRKPDLLGVEFE